MRQTGLKISAGPIYERGCHKLGGTVGYFDQLSGTVGSQKLVEIVFFRLFSSFQPFYGVFRHFINKGILSDY